MKKYILTSAFFMAIAGAMVALCLLMNTLAPRVVSGDRLPDDITVRHYVVSGLEYDEEAGGYPIFFSGVPQGEQLALTLYFRIAELWQGEERLASLSSSTSAQRTYTVPLTADEDGTITLFLKTAPGAVQGYSLKTLFTRYAAQSPKLILGSYARTQVLNGAGNSFYLLLIGLYLMLMVACLVLYRQKRSEQYLLTVCTAAAFVLLYLLTALESGMMLFPYGIASKLSALTNVLPVACLAYTCIGLFPGAVPPRFQKLFSLPSFLVGMAVCVFADLVLNIYTYQFLRRVMLFPVLVTMANALAQRQKGSRKIFVAYAMMEGIALFLYVNNCILGSEYSPLMMFVRLKEVSNLIFVATCAFEIFDRFSVKFVEADRLAEEVSVLNVELERKVEERTHQLYQEQEHKHSMMLNVFHDLRSPIFILKGYLNTMETQTEKDEEALQVMKTRVDYLERLTEDLFLTAKLESGDIQYDEDLVDLTALCGTVLRDMTTVALSHGVKLMGQDVQEGVTTWGDGFRLQQAVVNLVENAILYTPEGGKVVLSLEREGDRCLLRVTDTGKGIREEELSRVFERYYRTSNGNKRSSGLGISIAKDIIQAHRGEIRVLSQVGMGSEFTVDLPYCALEE